MQLSDANAETEPKPSFKLAACFCHERRGAVGRQSGEGRAGEKGLGGGRPVGAGRGGRAGCSSSAVHYVFMSVDKKNIKQRCQLGGQCGMGREGEEHVHTLWQTHTHTQTHIQTHIHEEREACKSAGKGKAMKGKENAGQVLVAAL